jgi:hypothetical protein
MTWGDFLLNLLVEVVGLAIGIPIAVWLASRAAKRRIDELAPPFVRLIKQLREDKTITEKAARQCVVCTAGILSQELIRSPTFSIPKHTSGDCKVCSLEFKTTSTPASERHCSHCGLKNNIWNIVEEQSA